MKGQGMSEKLKSLILTTDDLELFKIARNSKIPAVKGGFYSAKKYFDVVRAYVLGYNVGFKMGPTFIGIDMDEDESKNYHGIQVINELEKELGPLPATYTQRTPRGGLHKIYLTEGILNKPSGKITPAVDVKYAGYVLFHGSQINGKYYQAIDGVTADRKLMFSTLPQKWIDYIESNLKIVSPKKKVNYNYKPSVIKGDFKKMYENCSFVRRCVDNSYCLSEPEWHQFARLLNSFEFGEALFLKFSENYSGFNLEKAKQKFLYARKYPVNCRTISEVSDVCKECTNIYKGDI